MKRIIKFYKKAVQRYRAIRALFVWGDAVVVRYREMVKFESQFYPMVSGYGPIVSCQMCGTSWNSDTESPKEHAEWCRAALLDRSARRWLRRDQPEAKPND